mmetsp:Transcript_53352/g.106107  ORF Transcript_53352/g.106107 Transcript_53352/m.106107 type:complete len:117 (-) Transcript_53352:1334-1684(-)
MQTYIEQAASVPTPTSSAWELTDGSDQQGLDSRQPLRCNIHWSIGHCSRRKPALHGLTHLQLGILYLWPWWLAVKAQVLMMCRSRDNKVLNVNTRLDLVEPDGTCPPGILFTVSEE